jgi:ribosomal protein S18 acetylase RimI-like enzyme
LVRAARQQDLVNLAEVLASSFHPRQGVTGWAYPLLRVGIYKDLRSHLNTRSQHQVYLVAVQQTSHENLVGTVELSRRAAGFWQPDRPTALYLSNLAVLSDYRRQGIAQQLLAACEQIALDWGFQELYLHVLENNHSARQLYRKAGYRVQSAELSLLQWLMRQPRQLLLSKRLSA